MNAKTKQPDFEAALQELEAIVEKMEREELPLADALKQFERGVTLTKDCQSVLQQAEQKIKTISQSLQTPPQDDDA